jgi:hypothetical protein
MFALIPDVPGPLRLRRLRGVLRQVLRGVLREASGVKRNGRFRSRIGRIRAD